MNGVNIELSEDDIADIVKKTAHSELECVIEDEVYNQEIRDEVAKVLVEYIKSDEAKESFKEYYVEDGLWTECDEAVNDRVANLVINIFNQMTLVPKGE